MHATLQHISPTTWNPKVYQWHQQFLFSSWWNSCGYTTSAGVHSTALISKWRPDIPDCISVCVSRWMQPFLFSHLQQLGNNRRAATRVGASLSNHSLRRQDWFISAVYDCPQMPAGLWISVLNTWKQANETQLAQLCFLNRKCGRVQRRVFVHFLWFTNWKELSGPGQHFYLTVQQSCPTE